MTTQSTGDSVRSATAPGAVSTEDPGSTCRATGQVSGAARVGAAAGNLARAMLGLVVFGMLAVFLIAIGVAIIVSVV